MKTIKGLEKIYQSQPKRLTADTLAACLLTDLAQCHCAIYGLDSKEQPVLLARLHLVPETLVYDQFDKRIDLIVAGTIVSAEYVPLRYCLQGHEFAMTGRCSVIGKICGVDLYLQASYTCVVGDIARQKFSIPVKPLLN